LAKVICSYIDFLTVKALTNSVFAKDFSSLEQKRTRTASRVYKNAVFDTNRKSLLWHISAEKGLK
jgi:hypothetical protein